MYPRDDWLISLRVLSSRFTAGGNIVQLLNSAHKPGPGRKEETLPEGVTEAGVLAVGRVEVRGQRMPRREVGAGEASATPKAAESQAVVETLSHCGHAPNGVQNKFWNLLSCLPPNPSSCLSLAEPNWKPEIKRSCLGVSLLESRKWVTLVAGRTAECIKTERRLSWPPSVGAQHRAHGYCLVSKSCLTLCDPVDL